MELNSGGISIKAKLSFALVSISLGVVLIYIWIAKSTFESDKIAYVFEAHNNELQILAKEFVSQIDRSVLIAKAILVFYDFENKRLDAQGLRLFSDESSIIAIELLLDAKKIRLAHLEKSEFKLPKLLPEEIFLTEGKIEVFAINSDELLVVGMQRSDKGELLRLRILVQTPNIFTEKSGQTYLLASGRKLVRQSDYSMGNFTSIVAAVDDVAQQSTKIIEQDKQKFLLSRASTGIGGFSLFVLTPETVALGALDILYKRSVVFLLVTILFVVIGSIALSAGLTRNLGLLTQVASEVGQGNFETSVQIKSRDEVGVLFHAFSKMTGEIKRLLIETAENARMQYELKTAKTVQDTLFPSEPLMSLGGLTVTGRYRSATECGGDWWFYWRSGSRVFILIADATGHGAPAALLTSAARSTIATLEDRPAVQVEDVVKILHNSIKKCSQGRQVMSGFFLEIDVSSKTLRFVNASHLPLMVLPEDTSELVWRNVANISEPLSPAIGGNSDNFKVGTLKWEVNTRLILLTDGLTERKNPENKMPSERVFANQILDSHRKHPKDPDGFLTYLFDCSDEFAASAHQDDDLTAVVIQLT